MRKWALIYPLAVLLTELLLLTGSHGAFVFVTMRFVVLEVVSVGLLVWIPIVGWIQLGDEQRDQAGWSLVLFLEAATFLIASRLAPVPWIPRLG